MEYEVVKLEETIVVGLSARTNNTSPDMGPVIGGLWERFYQPGYFDSIENKKSGKSLGIYTEYAGTEMDDYTIIVGAGTTTEEQPAAIANGMEIRKIPAGTYAKFVVRGHMQAAVAKFWQELWEMKLPRAFVCDFEEYQDSGMEQAEIHIYISLKDQEK